MLDAHEALLESFIRATHHISVDVVLTILNNRLGLPTGQLHDLHRLTANSGDQVRFVKAPPQPAEDSRTALGAHTDFGSVTVLFAHVGGLQVLLPSAGTADDAQQNWAYVQPLPGRAIINLGDALVKFSAGLLRSNVHRVVAPPGEQAGLTKFSLVYFCRPVDEAMLRALEASPAVKERVRNGAWREEEEVVSSKEWVLRRALGRRGMRKWDDAGGTEGKMV
jgi:isopenicillin N synthase-like dioxygenase